MLVKVVRLASGFLIGQGSMFLLQTWLLYSNQLALLASIGISIGLLSLTQWVSDGGGVYLLQRGSFADVKRSLGSFIFTRILMGGGCLVLMLVLLAFFKNNSYVWWSLCVTPLIVIVWGFNISGITDHLPENKVIGPLSGVHWLFYSITVIAFEGFELAGLYSGVSYLLGLCLIVYLQYRVVNLRFSDLEFRFSGQKMKLILGFNFAYISAQGYSRILVLFVNDILGSAIAAVFIYSKNIANTVGQFIQFFRRIEFPYLYKYVMDKPLFSWGFFRIQAYSYILLLACCAFYGLVVVAIDVSGVTLPDDLIALVGFQLLVLSIWTFSSSLGQVMIAKGRLAEFGKVIFFTSFAALVVVMQMLGVYEVYLVVVVELCMLLIQVLLYLLLINRTKV